MWKSIGEAHGWKRPRAPAVKWLWKKKSTEAVLEMLRDTRLGRVSTRRTLPGETIRDEEVGSGDQEEEGGPAPRSCKFFFFITLFGNERVGCFFPLFFPLFISTFSFVWQHMGRRGKGCSARVDCFGLVQENVTLRKAAAAPGRRQAACMALWAACSGL